MTTHTNALWPDDDAQESLFGAPPAPTAATPGSVESVKAERAVSLTGWAPEFNALVPMSLADLFRLKAEYKIRVGHQTGDMDAAVLALTPAEGWPGKNAEQRADARALAISQSETVRNIQRLLDESAEFLTRVDAEINARDAELTEQKRAMERLEWDIRAREIQLRRDELDHARAVFNATHHTESH